MQKVKCADRISLSWHVMVGSSPSTVFILRYLALKAFGISSSCLKNIFIV